MLYVRFPLSLRNVEDLLHERGIEVSPESVRFWWMRFGPMFSSEIRRKWIGQIWTSGWRWHLDEVFVNDSDGSIPSQLRGAIAGQLAASGCDTGRAPIGVLPVSAEFS